MRLTRLRRSTLARSSRCIALSQGEVCGERSALLRSSFFCPRESRGASLDGKYDGKNDGRPRTATSPIRNLLILQGISATTDPEGTY